MLLLIIVVIFQGAKLVEKSHKTIPRPIFYPFLALIVSPGGVCGIHMSGMDCYCRIGLRECSNLTRSNLNQTSFFCPLEGLFGLFP